MRSTFFAFFLFFFICAQASLREVPAARPDEPVRTGSALVFCHKAVFNYIYPDCKKATAAAPVYFTPDSCSFDGFYKILTPYIILL